MHTQHTYRPHPEHLQPARPYLTSSPWTREDISSWMPVALQLWTEISRLPSRKRNSSSDKCSVAWGPGSELPRLSDVAVAAPRYHHQSLVTQDSKTKNYLVDVAVVAPAPQTSVVHHWQWCSTTPSLRGPLSLVFSRSNLLHLTGPLFPAFWCYSLYLDYLIKVIHYFIKFYLPEKAGFRRIYITKENTSRYRLPSAVCRWYTSTSKFREFS